MTFEEAVANAVAASGPLGVPSSFLPLWAKRLIVEIVPGQAVVDALPGPGPVIDRISWLVHLGVDRVWAELVVDDETGRILRLRRSRGAAALGCGDGS